MEDLLKRPLHDLRISVTDKCNFRCPYCMPKEKKYKFLPKEKILSYEEIEILSKIFVSYGVKKLRITGGEPLIRKDLPVLIKKLVAIDGVEDIALTTNGYFLAQHALALKDAGLTRITVSLDALDHQLSNEFSGGRGDIEGVLKAIDIAADLGFSIKINTVVKKGVNDSEIIPLIKYFRNKGHIIRFIEYMDVGNINGWKMDHVLPSKNLVDKIHDIYPCEPADPNYTGEVASRWRFLDGNGEFGVISSVTEAFCGTCSRARISANGFFYTCLFASSGYDLKKFFQESDAEKKLSAEIYKIWSGRDDRYSLLRSEQQANESDKIKLVPAVQDNSDRVEMYEMGG